MIHKNWLELIKPTQLVVKPGADAQRTATVYAEPLERGFGLTLGNALRRVLMSSLQGGAITSVQIDNVLHEFSSVAGVREDVTDIVLNLKGVSLKMEVEGPKRLSISAKGPGVVTAGDISETNGIEVLNKEHVICHLDDGADVEPPDLGDLRVRHPPAAVGIRLRRDGGGAQDGIPGPPVPAGRPFPGGGEEICKGPGSRGQGRQGSDLGGD